MQITERIARSCAAQDDVFALISSIPDAAYADESALPGWSVGHVVAHLIGNCAAQTRQIEFAQRGERVEVYSGGQATRDADIERRALLDPRQLRAELAIEHGRYAAIVQSLDPADALAPVEYRDGTITDVISGRWMECLVHAVDLHQPHFTCRSWDEPFCRLLIGYLLERLPQDRSVQLTATNTDFHAVVGKGTPIAIAAPIAEIAGFLSDRGPSLVPDLELGPYPRGSIKR